MGIFDWFKRLFSYSPPADPYHRGRGHSQSDWNEKAPAGRAKPGRDPACIARLLQMPYLDLTDVPTAYRTFTIPKRDGRQRRIDAPNEELKKVQRKILRRVLSGLRSHPSVHGFERGRSIVTNAAVHTGQAVVLRMDIRDFFHNTRADRVCDYFRRVGWNKASARLLTRLTTLEDRLPQGAATSGRLANLVNYQMDVRLTGLAESFGAKYTRYADDLTFSLAQDVHRHPNLLISAAKAILADYGYTLHHNRKLHIRRRHQCQEVTGLCVNQGVRLPRRTRRRLRAIRHRQATTGQCTLTPDQLAGWDALEKMIFTQSLR